MKQGLNEGSSLADIVQATLGTQPNETFLREVASTAVFIDLFIGTFIPVIIVCMLTRLTAGTTMASPTSPPSVSNVVGDGWPFVAPLIGSLGSFISGSATFSSMMFSLFQFSVSDQIAANPQVILALQILGANAGNMICVLNVVAAASVVNLVGKEGTIIRMTLVPMLFYVAMAGIIGFILL